MLKYISLLLLLYVFVTPGKTQNITDDYQLIQSLDTKMKRKVFANELILDKQEKYIIVNYGNKPTFIILFDMVSYDVVANFRLSNWIEFSGAYIDYETNQFYVKESRFSNEYYRLDINTGEQDIVECQLTPAGCVIEDLKITRKSVFSSSKDFYITINKRNKRDVKVYQLRR